MITTIESEKPLSAVELANREQQLTRRQADVLAVIRSFYRTNGVPPSIREVANVIGVGNTNAVMTHLRPLIRKGVIRHIGKMKSRSYLPIVPEGHCPCCGLRHPWSEKP